MTLSATEQYILELINRARLDPLAEAARYGLSSLNQGLAPGTLSSETLQALAPDSDLLESARAHSTWMLATDTFSHTGVNGSTARQRMEAAGYNLVTPWATGENIALIGGSPAANLATAAEAHHRGLFLSADHRTNILKESYREIGIGQVAGNYNGMTASALTENFGRTGHDVFLTGVAFADTNRDGFYSVGEGQGGIGFAIAGLRAATATAGGYGISLDATGLQRTTVTVGSLTATLDVEFAGQNVKLDLVNGVELRTSGSLQLISGITSARLLGHDDLWLGGTAGADRLWGNSGDNLLRGAAGADMLNGGLGSDTAGYGGAGGVTADLQFASVNTGDAKGDVYDSIENLSGSSGRDILRGNNGNNSLWGGDQADFIAGRGGNDNLLGDRANDVLMGGEGGDLLDGGADIDQASYIYAARGVTVDLVTHAANTGEAAGDRFIGIEDVAGSNFNDILRGDTGHNLLIGGGGSDRLEGRAGDDRLNGGAGGDTLSGDVGNDRLWGGAAADVFQFSTGRDVIEDMDTGGVADRIGLSRTLTAGLTDGQAIASRFGTVSNNVCVLDFGGGHVLTVVGVTSLTNLGADIFLF